MQIDHEHLEQKIYQVRGQKVMLDSDLAELYGVETSALNRQVKRNIDRFPSDFMMKLTESEFQNLICQIGTSSSGHHLIYMNVSGSLRSAQDWNSFSANPLTCSETMILAPLGQALMQAQQIVQSSGVVLYPPLLYTAPVGHAS